MNFNVKDDQHLGRLASVLQPFMDWTLEFLPVLAVVLAVLMISRVRYMHVMNRMLRGQEPFDYVVKILLVGFFALLTKPFSLPLIFLIYAGSGIVVETRARLLFRRALAASKGPHMGTGSEHDRAGPDGD